MLRFIFIIFCLTVSFGFAGTLEQIQWNASSGKLTGNEAIVFEMLHIYAPEKLPAEYQSVSHDPVKCGFGGQARLYQHWNELSPEQRILMHPYIMRPSLPETLLSPRGLFKVHYTTTGIDAIPVSDENQDGVPDFVEEAAASLDLAYTVQVEQMGFRAPLNDDVDGPEYDVYMVNYNGYGETVLAKRVADSPANYEAYIKMDNDFQEVYSKGLNGLRVTCAHEFFHLVQLAYQYRDSDIFLMEASATWMEDQLYDSVNDYLQYLNRFINNDNTRFNTRDGWREYGLSIWFHFLEARYSRNIVKDIWEDIVAYPALDAMDHVINRLNMSLVDEMTKFYGWNVMTGLHSDTLNYYPEGHLYPEISLNSSFVQSDTSYDFSIINTGVRYVSTNFSDGTHIIWAPVNCNWQEGNSSAFCQLMITQYQTQPFWDAVSSGVNASLVSEDDNHWKYNAIVMHPNSLPQLQVFNKKDETMFCSISGTVLHVQPLSFGDTLTIEGLSEVILDCSSTGEDSVFDTEDDLTFPSKQTSVAGEYAFIGLSEGLYRIRIDLTTAPEGLVPVFLKADREFNVSTGERIADVNFSFRSLTKTALPCAVPNPYSPAEWPEMKLPFVLDEAGYFKCVIYNSNGFIMHEMSGYFGDLGVHFFRWNGHTDNGMVPAGIYLYVITRDGSLIRQDKFAIVH